MKKSSSHQLVDVPNMEVSPNSDLNDATTTTTTTTNNLNRRTNSSQSSGSSSSNNNKKSSSNSSSRPKRLSNERRSLTSHIQADQLDAFDAPILDDNESLWSSSAASADAAAGGGGGSGRNNRGGGRSFSSSNSSSSNNDKSLRGGVSSTNTKKKSSTAIIIEDEEEQSCNTIPEWGESGSREELSSALRKTSTPTTSTTQHTHTDRRSSLDKMLSTFDSSSSKALDLEMPTFSNNRRGSTSTFDNLWNVVGGSSFAAGNNNKDHVSSDEDQSSDQSSVDTSSLFGGYNTTTTSSNNSENNMSMKLMRTISGRVGFIRGESGRYASSYRANSNNDTPCRKCCNFVRLHAKLTFICLLVLVLIAASIGALVVVVPLWVDSGEDTDRGVSYGIEDGKKDSGIVLDNSGGSIEDEVEQDETEREDTVGIIMDSSSVGEDEVEVEGEKEDAGDSPAQIESDATSLNNEEATDQKDLPVVENSVWTRPVSNYFFKAPPKTLDQICSTSSILEADGYTRCVHTCLSSRCCLVNEGDPYRVHTLHHSTLDDLDEDVEIGTIIPSCAVQYKGMCEIYNEHCSIIGDLLPRRIPSPSEVMGMNGAEKLELAEWINHSCKGKDFYTTNGDGSECQLLCQEKACCFAKAKDDAVDEGETDQDNVTTYASSPPTVIVASSSSTPDPDEDGFITRKRKERHRRLQTQNNTMEILNTTEEMANRESNSLPELESNSSATANKKVTVSTASPPPSSSSSCVDDLDKNCMTYAGCEPLFS